MFNSAKISVVMPLYNKERDVEKTLESVFAQNHKPFEVIVVDDGSTDKSIDIVNRFPGVTLIQQANAGVSAARNRGIQSASGDFIAFLDADDLWSPHFLSEINYLITAFPGADAFTTRYQCMVERDQYKKPKIRFAKPVQSPQILDNYFDIGSRGALPFMMSSFVIRTAKLATVGMFPEGEPMGEDQEVFCQTALQCKIAYSPRILVIYNEIGSNRACVRNVPEKECPFSSRLQRVAEFSEDKKLQESIFNYCAAHILHLASLNVRSGNVRAAKALLKSKLAQRNKLRCYWWTLRSLMASRTVA